MAKAYPQEAGIQACRRSLRIINGALCLADEILLDGEQPVTWVFMLRQKPVVDQSACCCRSEDGVFKLTWSQECPLTVACEAMEITDGRMNKSYPGMLWRLTLTSAPAVRHVQQFQFEA